MRTLLIAVLFCVLCVLPLSGHAGGKGGHPGGHGGGHSGGGHSGGHSGGHGGGHHGGHGGHHRGSITNNYSSTSNNTRYMGGIWGYTTLDNKLSDQLTGDQIDMLGDVNAHLNGKFRR
jgi:hypothetical protein